MWPHDVRVSPTWYYFKCRVGRTHMCVCVYKTFERLWRCFSCIKYALLQQITFAQKSNSFSGNRINSMPYIYNTTSRVVRRRHVKSKTRIKGTSCVYNIYLLYLYFTDCVYNVPRLPTLSGRTHPGKIKQIKLYAFGAVGGSKTNILRARRALQPYLYYNNV